MPSPATTPVVGDESVDESAGLAVLDLPYRLVAGDEGVAGI